MDPRNPAIHGVRPVHRRSLPIDVPVFDFVEEPDCRSDEPAIGAPAMAASAAAWIIGIGLALWVGKLAWGFLS
ncbi:hypothetical protein [Paracoccus sp. SM22M-07]|uniref:hypothetical protein n=1 Tax=Paracoccus sp. SM22M-07 TaxID=1520813 RepID=UPI000914A8B9|nr:hypothetical protein [Paracoccus sp. SM22M-07]OJH46151.1 hypothetical protein IE00_02765 [Paracoccus sp. SM22M-07]